MKALAIFVAFFLIFTSASIAVPIPLFPGSMVPTLLKISPSDYLIYLEALINGLTYGFLTWIIFRLIDKKLESQSIAPEKKQSEERVSQ